MSTSEHNCIRYLMKEMDPSEELEFEHLMREDENILIEVESLRATYKKTAHLPLINPPENITQNILHDLKQLQSSNKSLSSKRLLFAAKGLAAAVVVAALTGSYIYFQDYSAAGETAAPEQVTENTEIQPWVDINEVIGLPYQIKNTGAASVYGSRVSGNWTNEVQQSYEKLKLVKYFNVKPGSNSGFHLTGTSE